MSSDSVDWIHLKKLRVVVASTVDATCHIHWVASHSALRVCCSRTRTWNAECGYYQDGLESEGPV